MYSPPRCWSQQEIADLLGVTRQAVAYHEKKALQKIRKKLVEKWGEDGAIEILRGINK